MSAIAAVLRCHGEPIRDGEIERLIDAMKARGPDGVTVWSDGSVALACAKLHGTPESLAEQQPLAAVDGRFRMIWDGRLDNRDELRHELSLHHVQPRDDTDPELVLQTYLLHGERTPERLLGDFAFAIWDAQQQRLFCARDHIGARPFYYVLNDHFFALASEDEALLTLEGMSAVPNEDRLIYALVPSFDAFDWKRSWLKDVQILMPGTRMSVDCSRRVRRDVYWRMSIPDSDPPARSFESYQSEFAQVFSQAVADRMRSHAPIAAMMSGGMDSASVCAMATRLTRAQSAAALSTFSAVEDDDAQCLESISILQMAGRLDLNASFLRVPSLTGFASAVDLAQVYQQYVHPTDASLGLVSMMCLGASRAGHRVLLHGASGDVANEAPLYYLPEVLHTFGMKAALRELKMSAAHHTYLAGLGAPQIVARNAYRALVPEGLKRARIRAQERFGAGRNRWRPLAPSVVDASALDRRMARSRIHALSVVGKDKNEHYAAMFPIGVLRGLEGYERVAGHFGLEMRDPWADRRVLEFMLRAPVFVKTGDGWTKRVVRAEFEADVGGDVVWRSDKPHLGWRFATEYSATAKSDNAGALSSLLANAPSVDEDASHTVALLRAWLARIG